MQPDLDGIPKAPVQLKTTKILEMKMNQFTKLESTLRELRIACRKMMCANLRLEMAIEELKSLGPHATVEQIKEIAEKYRRK
jgi:hypothetical protein